MRRSRTDITQEGRDVSVAPASSPDARKRPVRRTIGSSSGWTGPNGDEPTSAERSLRASPTNDLKLAIDSFRTYCRSRNFSQRTIEYYNDAFVHFGRFIDSSYPGIGPAEVTTHVVRQFLAQERERVSQTTVCHRYTALCVLFKHLVTDGYIQTSPMTTIDKSKRLKPMIPTFSLEQVEAILNSCDDRCFTGVRDRALILAMFDSGLRVSEVVVLKLEDIDWENQTFKVLGKGNKESISPFGPVSTATTQLLSLQLVYKIDNVEVSTPLYEHEVPMAIRLPLAIRLCLFGIC